MGAAVEGRTAQADLVGRERDLRELQSLLGRGRRLLTLVGPPGIGKSRLARALCAMVDAPTIECDATVASDLADLVELVARSLGLPPGGAAREGRAPEAIGRVMHERGELVLLLDGLERVAEPAATTVGQWLEDAPRVTVIVTSRVPLRLSTEARYEVGPLSTDRPGQPNAMSDAGELFVRRAAAARGEWTPSSAERADVEEIARRLEGIPLAIELAAARMRTLGTREIRSHVARPLDLAARGPRDTAARHVTLRAAIDDSWQLLSPAQRDALAQLSVFVGRFDLDAAEAVLDLGGHEAAPWVLEMIETLADRSLLQSLAGDPPLVERRFRLYDSIREFAAEKLAEGGRAEDAWQRHAACYLERAERWAAELRGPEAREALARLRADQHDVAEVVRRQLERDPTLAARAVLSLTALTEALGGATAWAPLVDRVIDALGTRAPVTTARLRLARARIRTLRGEHREAAADLDAVLEVVQREDEGALASEAAAQRCMVAWRLGDVAQAETMAAQALERARGVADRRLEGDALRLIGTLRLYAGDVPAATEHLERAVALHEATGDALALGIGLDRLGEAAHRTGKLDVARKCWEEALETQQRVGNRRWEAITRSYLAELCATEGDLDGGETHLQEALRAYREVGDRSAGAVLLVQLGLFALARDRRDDAFDRFGTALGTARGGGHEQHAGLARGYRGVAAPDDANDAACEDLRAASRFFERAHNDSIAALFAGWLAVREARAGNGEAAAEALARAETMHGRGNNEALLQTLPLQRVLVDLAGAASAPAAGHPLAQRTVVDAARRVLADAERTRHLALDARVLLPYVRRAIADARRAGDVPLELHPDAAWFRPPGGDRVDMTRRQAARRILLDLVRARLARPGDPVARERLVQVGWPGERILAEAASNRLRVAISTLRKAGLGAILETHAQGYRLDPEVPIRIAEDV